MCANEKGRLKLARFVAGNGSDLLCQGVREREGERKGASLISAPGMNLN